MPDVDSIERHPAFCFYSLAIENRQSTFEISCGGIAQLVERQLCKLEVRGSNPLASSLRSRRREWRRLSRRSLGKGGPFSPCGCKRGELRLGKPTNSMGKFFYIYILQSESDENRFYTGLTDDLPKRLKGHNSGRVLHTAKWKPWRLKAYFALPDRIRATEFKQYLKSASGRAFVKKHF